MGDNLEFVRNFNDLSTDKGFQFEFCCDHCGAGYRTTFQSPLMGRMSGVLNAAGSVFNVLTKDVARVGGKVRSAAWDKAHDEALVAGIEALRPSFAQCPRCFAWVCRKDCWDLGREMCKECASGAGADSGGTRVVRATCPKCDMALAVGAKFCPQCGTKLARQTRCAVCGTALTPNANFCPECGAKVER